MPVPAEVRTARLVLRPWRAEDAADLQPILEANHAHLAPWIPVRVSTPAPVPELTERLERFAADFAANREWRYGIFTPDAWSAWNSLRAATHSRYERSISGSSVILR